MYSAVAARTREIATLRALGFGGGAIVVSLMLESLALALAGGCLGGGLAYLAFNNFHTSTMNWQSFSQVAFAFRVTPALLHSRDDLGGGDRADRRLVPGHPRRPPPHRLRVARVVTYLIW